MKNQVEETNFTRIVNDQITSIENMDVSDFETREVTPYDLFLRIGERIKRKYSPVQTGKIDIDSVNGRIKVKSEIWDNK